MKSSGDKEENLEWSDIEIDHRSVSLGLKSIIVKVWFSSFKNEGNFTVLSSWGVNFSGLWCLGTHAPSYGLLPPNSLVFQLSGSFFSSASYVRDSGKVENNQIPRYLHIGTVEEYQVTSIHSFTCYNFNRSHIQTVKSYDTTLLSRLHMSQRALKQQDSNNMRLIKDLQNLGIGKTCVSVEDALIKPDDSTTHSDVSVVNPSALPSMRQTLLARKYKHPQTRLLERDLEARIEILKIRIALLQKERDRRKDKVEDTRNKQKALMIQMEEKTSNQMNCYHNLSKDKSAFQSWTEQFQVDQLANESWFNILKQERLLRIRGLSDIFPIGDLGGKRPTLRWTLLPPSDEIRDCIRDENHVSVVVSDVAHLTYVMARILDVPLRYPIRLLGSTSTIQDNVRVFLEQEMKKDAVLASGEFPLYIRSSSNNEWSKFEYALHLLNKNLAQLRWLCDLPTTDLRPTLHNLHEVMVLAKNPEVKGQIYQLPIIRTLTCPVNSSKSGGASVLIKNGKIAFSTAASTASILSARRKSSSASEKPFVLNIQESDNENTAGEAPNNSVPDQTVAPEIIEKSIKLGDCLSSSQSLQKENKNHNRTEDENTNVFWNDVTSRAKALSNPSSFQRPRPHHF